MSRRTVTVTIGNLDEQAAVAVLSLEALPEADLVRLGYPIPPERLTIRSGRILPRAPASTLAGCREAIWDAVLAVVARWWKRPVFTRPMTLRLRPMSTVDVVVALDVTGALGAAGVRLVDRRGGRIVGGVTVLAFEGIAEQRPSTIPAEKPCPMSIEPLVWLPHRVPADRRSEGGPLPVDLDVDLVAWVSNPTDRVLSDATAYLEHLGGAPADFRAGRWNLGEFGPGMRFPLRWCVTASSAAAGQWAASIVVAATGFDPTRVRLPVAMGEYAPPETFELEIARAEPDVA